MLKQGQDAVDEVFLKNVAQRVPVFLTASLVHITKTLTLQKDYFRDHPLWTCLENELLKRRKNLDN